MTRQAAEELLARGGFRLKVHHHHNNGLAILERVRESASAADGPGPGFTRSRLAGVRGALLGSEIVMIPMALGGVKEPSPFADQPDAVLNSMVRTPLVIPYFF